MSCQCEIYEICLECAPSREAFVKVANDNDNVIRQHRVSSSKSYTLDDLTRLAAEWITDQEGDTEMLKWTFSIFIEWARKREREVGE